MTKWKKFKQFVFSMVVLVLILSVFTSVFTIKPNPSPVNIQPSLAEIAANSPNQIVAAIIQVKHNNQYVETLVSSLGGEITHDLQILNALTAQLPAAAAVKLAHNPNVRWVALDTQVQKSKRGTVNESVELIPSPENYFLDTLNVRPVWDLGLLGQGITVAVIDSGVNQEKDLQVDPNKAKPDSRVIEQLTFNSNSGHSNDATGHGTHVAGIIAGSGYRSKGLYAGIAPQVNIISLKICDENGMAYESDAIAAMQWVLENKDKFNIRVVNMSVNATQESSYHSSPMNAAAEILWFNGIVVVASVGNKGSGSSYNTANAAPANDPFIITVGATDEHNSSDYSDDTLASFSAHGKTSDGFSKPELVAPGTNIISILGPENWIPEYPEHAVMNGEYFRLSGTSMSAPMVSGAVALLLQDEPGLTPDQVKFRLMDSARAFSSGRTYLDIDAAVNGDSFASANTGIFASQLLWSGIEPVSWESVAWNSVAWNSVAWNSVAWNSVAWNSVAWNSVAWNSVFWGD